MPVTNRVRYFRFMHGEMSQAELAENVGVSRQTIVAVEKGNYNPSVELALRLARELAITVEELFVLTEEAP
jgi:putative transcriptional regulator